MIKIRKANKNDYEILWNLDKMWYAEGISPYRSKPVSLAKYKSICNEAIIFLAEENKQIIGFSMATKHKAKKRLEALAIEKGDEYLDLDGVYVVGSQRGKSIGRELVLKLVRAAKKEGFEKIRLVADSKEQEKLLDFYYKLGAKRMWTRMRFDLK